MRARGDTLTLMVRRSGWIVFLRMTGALLSLAQPWAATRR